MSAELLLVAEVGIAPVCTLASLCGSKCRREIVDPEPAEPALVGICFLLSCCGLPSIALAGIGETDLALALVRPISIVGASASSPPSPMITGGASRKATLKFLGLFPLCLPGIAPCDRLRVC